MSGNFHPDSALDKFSVIGTLEVSRPVGKDKADLQRVGVAPFTRAKEITCYLGSTTRTQKDMLDEVEAFAASSSKVFAFVVVHPQFTTNALPVGRELGIVPLVDFIVYALIAATTEERVLLKKSLFVLNQTIPSKAPILMVQAVEE